MMTSELKTRVDSHGWNIFVTDSNVGLVVSSFDLSDVFGESKKNADYFVVQ